MKVKYLPLQLTSHFTFRGEWLVKIFEREGISKARISIAHEANIAMGAPYVRNV
jgi:hypothetical protein